MIGDKVAIDMVEVVLPLIRLAALLLMWLAMSLPVRLMKNSSGERESPDSVSSRRGPKIRDQKL